MPLYLQVTATIMRGGIFSGEDAISTALQLQPIL